MFNIVQFKNDPCPISDSEEGICYREDECTQKGGVARSKCASGFGICCLCKLSSPGGFLNFNRLNRLV